MKPQLTFLLVSAVLVGGCARTAALETAPAAEPVEQSYPTAPPELGPAPSLTLPTPERRTLSNGLEVVYVRKDALPIVHATLVTRGGTTDDPTAFPGLADFTSEALDEGAAGRSALELANELDLLGATLSTGAGWDAAFVDLHVLRPQLPEALRLMADVTVRPGFPEAEVERLREERLTDLARARDEARVIAGNAFASLVYGGDHSYGRLATSAVVRQIDRAALERFHQAYYRPAGSTLILVGDVDPAELHSLVEQAFGSWQGAVPAAPVAPPTPEIGPTTVYLVDKPGAEQSEIRIGHPGVTRNDPDYFPVVVLNTLLGGSFTSRLNTNLREEHGYAYGARSAYSMRRGAGPFTASSAVFTAKTDSAVAEFFHELRRIRTETVPADELQRAKSYVALGLPRRFETTEDVASQLAELETYGLSIDFYNDYVSQVMAVTAEDIRRVAEAYIRPDRSVVVVVGDRETIEPGLRALGVGSLEIREVEEFVR